MKEDIVKWGIIGLGKIAQKFASDLLLVDNVVLAAVASRDKSKAKLFAEKFQAQDYFASYEELFLSDQVDIVYIATPHDSHMRWSIQALQHGKAVLCEKPVVVNHDQLTQVLKNAKISDRFFMEGLWSRFNPTIISVMKAVNEDIIGEVKHISANFSFKANYDPNSRLFDPNRAGGALLDVGIYPIFLAYLLKGVPDEISASSILHDNGIDLQTTVMFSYADASAFLIGGILVNSDMVAKIYGSKGNIFIHKRWHEADSYTLEIDGEKKGFQAKRNGHGFTYEIEECNQCLRTGRVESILWTHKNSSDLMKILDEVRDEIGLKYPFEV